MSNFKYTKEEVKRAYEIIEATNNRITDVGYEIGFFEDCYAPEESSYEIDFETNQCHIRGSDNYMGCYDCITDKFPIDFLFEDESLHKDYIKLKRERAKQEKLEQKMKAEEERERKELERLKKKYE